MSAISETAKKVWKATWSVFKRILFNPVTIALLVGGLFLFFAKKLFDMMGGTIDGVKKNIIPMIVNIALKVWEFLKGLAVVVFKVGKILVKIVDALTNPEGFVVKTVVWIIKAIRLLKKWVKTIIKATGKDSIDVACMFLAGDMVGLALHFIAGLVVKFWTWLKRTPLMRKVLGAVKAIVAVIGLIAEMPTLIWKALWGATKSFFTGRLDEVADAFCAPYKKWWNDVKKVFNDGWDLITKPEQPMEFLDGDPTDETEEKATKAKIAIKSLKMAGVEKNLDYIERFSNRFTQYRGDKTA